MIWFSGVRRLWRMLERVVSWLVSVSLARGFEPAAGVPDATAFRVLNSLPVTMHPYSATGRRFLPATLGGQLVWFRNHYSRRRALFPRRQPSRAPSMICTGYVECWALVGSWSGS